MRLPAAWIRSETTPPCAEGWTRILAAWWQSGRTAAPFRSTGTGDVWIGWLLPSRNWQATAPKVLEDCQAPGVKGLVLDPEEAWLGASDEEAAELVRYFTSRGVRVWLCSYALPPPAFPLEGFASGGIEGGIAQTHDRRLEFSGRYLGRCLARWRARGVSLVVGCVGLWYEPPGPTTGRTKTPDELRRHLAQRPRASVIWGPPTWAPRVCAALTRWQTTGPASGGAGSGLLLALLAAGVAWAATR